MLSVAQLGGRAEIHRLAVVDEQKDLQIFFFEEEADEQFFEPAEEVPIDVAQVVADGIRAEVGEFGTAPFAFGQSVTFHPARADLARHEFQRFQPPEELRGKQWAVDGQRGGYCHKM